MSGVKTEQGVGRADTFGGEEGGGGEGRWAAVTPNPKAKRLDQLREVMRLGHYSLRTERSYRDGVRRLVRFHRMTGRADLGPVEEKIELLLSSLAVAGRVAVSTQNQAFNALLFLYRQMLHRPLERILAVSNRPAGRMPEHVGSTPEQH